MKLDKASWYNNDIMICQNQNNASSIGLIQVPFCVFETAKTKSFYIIAQPY